MCVVLEPGACSASQELPSRYDAPNTCTVHVVMHSQLRWRARAHGADGRTSAATFGGLVFFSAVCVGALRRSGARPCELQTPLGTLTTRSAPRACAAATLGTPICVTVRIFGPLWLVFHVNALFLILIQIQVCFTAIVPTFTFLDILQLSLMRGGKTFCRSFETIWAPNRFGLGAKRFAPSRPWSHMRLHLLAMERVHGREYSWERKTLAPAAKDAVREAGGGVS